MAYRVREIVAHLGGEYRGDGEALISQVAPLARASEGEISFVSHTRHRKELGATKAQAVILPQAMADSFVGTCIVAADPYLYFAQLTQLLNPLPPAAPGIHPSSVVQSSLPASVSVGPLAYVGERCVFGEDVVIGAGCMIESGVTLGAKSLLHARVTIYADSVIGERCILHAGCVIGSDGFGFARRADGSWEKIPQIGRVVLGDDVEIGANTTIDRGALDDTIIESGVKLDNLIQIAHNCRIGEHTAMAAFAGMAGSSKLGKRVMVGGQAGIMGHTEVADDVVVSARSFISKSVTEQGTYTSAIPAQPHKEWMRNTVHLKHLDELADRIRALEKKLNDLEKKA